MKILRILAVLILFGCAPYQTLDQLKAEAKVTGDWTKVDKKLDRLEREEAKNFPRCPSNKTEICNNWRCRCLTKDQLPMFVGQF